VTKLYNKVRELISVKVLHRALLNMTVVALRVLPLGRYAAMSGLSPSFKTVLELVLCNCLHSYRRISPDVISVIKMPPVKYFLHLREEKEVIGARSGELGGCSSTVICLLAKNSLTDSALIQAPTFSRRHTKTHTENNRRNTD
jgi:hypothetical protein